jgi:hypothetical protein
MKEHLRALVSVAVAALWIAMATAAACVSTPQMHCHGIPMPCCPPSDAGAAHCASAPCMVEAPQKAETPYLQATLMTAAAETLPPQRFPAPRRELVRRAPGKPAVFRLKDDLRI